jgi:uncharacterized protein (DUF362 family)
MVCVALPAMNAAEPRFSRERETAPARVVTVHDPEATRGFVPREDRVRAMIQRGLINLTGQPTPAAAWQSLVSTGDMVGIKVYTAPGPQAGTRPAVIAAVVESLVAAQMPPGRIIVWDRHLEDLRRAGLGSLAAQYGIGLAGAEDADYDEGTFYETPLLGNLVWGDLEFRRSGEGIGRKSFVSKLLTRRITRIINLTPLLNHNTAGVSGNLFGLALGSVDNTLRFESDAGRLATAVPEIYALPALGDRVVLNIVDGLICQYMGEQRTLLHHATMLNEIRFSKDPVALDVLSIRELDTQRKAAGQASNAKPLEVYENAELMELGVAEPTRIQVERLEP